MKKKNCHNCIHSELDTTDFEMQHNSVYLNCTKRDDRDEITLERNLERPEYLEKAKRCCELKTQPNRGVL